MTQATLRPPSNLQPRPKAVPTFSSASIAASSTPQQASRQSSKSRQSSPVRLPEASNASDRATAAFIRRTLCPHNHGATNIRPIHDLLPPLTSSNNVDLQLYAIIAIVVKDLVQSWYGKITPDQDFVQEVVRIIAHCTTQLESRLRTVDLESLCLDGIPNLVSNHVHAYKTSHRPLHTALSTQSRIIYHNLIPHPALSPIPDPSIRSSMTEQEVHEAEYRQLLVQGALAVLLPTEDLENVCLRTLVADVTADSILGNSIGGRVCENWFIWSSTSKIIEMVKANLEAKATGEQIEVDTRSRLEKFGLLSDKSKGATPTKPIRRSAFSSSFWRILQYCYLAFLSLRFLIHGLIAAYSQPLRFMAATRPYKSTESPQVEKTVESHRRPRPLVAFGIFPLASILFNLPSHMPWLSGSIALLQHQLIHGPLRIGATDGILDQFLHHLLATNLDPATLLPQLLSLARLNLFPNTTLPSASPPPPSPAEINTIKRACAINLLSLFPPAVARRLFGGGVGAGAGAGAGAGNGVGGDEKEREDDEREGWIENVDKNLLDVFSDAYMNKHLAYQILESVVVRVLPELGEKRVEELMRERIGDV